MQISFDQNITGKLVAGLGKTTYDKQVVIQLKGSSLLVLERPRHPVTIRGVGGVLWVTQEGNRQDYMLQAGEAITLAKGGLIVVQALGCGCMQVIDE